MVLFWFQCICQSLKWEPQFEKINYPFFLIVTSTLHGEESFYATLASSFEVNNKTIESIDYQLPKYLNVTFIKSATPSIKFYFDELRAQNLPVDLALIPLIESANNPRARSPKDALGLWQFMPATANQFGLKVSKQKDERLHVIASTRVAINYFIYLYNELKDWNLVLMAYNWGIGSVNRLIDKKIKQNQNLQLKDLPLETQEYLLRFYGLKKIIKKYANTELNYFTNAPYVTKIRYEDLDTYLSEQNISTISNDVLIHMNGIDLNQINNYPIDILVPTKLFLRYFSTNEVNVKKRQTKKTSCTYQVRQGETFTSIGKSLAINVNYLKDLNANLTFLRPGMNIKLCEK